MKTNDYLLIGALAAGAYIFYKLNYGGTSRAEAVRSFQSSGTLFKPAVVYSSQLNHKNVNVTYEGTNWGSTNTTYSFNPEEISKYNWAQQFLNSLNFIPKNWIFGG